MDGMTVLLVMEVRQTSLVVTQRTRADEIKADFNSSHLWPKVQVLSLPVNMRVHLNGSGS